MEHVPYFEVFCVLVLERSKNWKNLIKIFFYQCIKDAKICSVSVFQLKKDKNLQKFSVRNVRFPLIPFRVLGITKSLKWFYFSRRVYQENLLFLRIYTKYLLIWTHTETFKIWRYLENQHFCVFLNKYQTYVQLQ